MTRNMDRLFLDANVLFSAAYRPDAGLTLLWQRRGVTLITSSYALAEAQFNLVKPDQRDRLAQLAVKLHIISEPFDPQALASLSGMPDLPAKDRPILAAAIRACTLSGLSTALPLPL